VGIRGLHCSELKFNESRNLGLVTYQFVIRIIRGELIFKLNESLNEDTMILWPT
jgi:hypothetical protein